jgi:hypothetical protein
VLGHESIRLDKSGAPVLKSGFGANAGPSARSCHSILAEPGGPADRKDLI